MVLGNNFDYYYGNEAEQFTFYRIPKILFTDERLSKISADAKILYGLLLDRMSLSMKNGWLDSENKVYIYFTVEEVMECLNIGRGKCAKIFAELDEEKGCGLIRRKVQGLGKPAIIYVMKFFGTNKSLTKSVDDTIDENKNSDCQIINCTGVAEPDFLEFENRTSGDLEESNLLKSENRISENSKNELPETQKMNSSNTDNNKTDYNNTNSNIYHPILSYHKSDMANVQDEMRERIRYREFICENIDYSYLSTRYGEEAVNGIVEIMVDAICSKKPYIFVNSEEILQENVKNIFLKLNSSHMEYVFDCLRKNKTKIRNIKNYLLTALYNAYSTIDHYYTAEVNCDFK